MTKPTEKQLAKLAKKQDEKVTLEQRRMLQQVRMNALERKHTPQRSFMMPMALSMSVLVGVLFWLTTGFPTHETEPMLVVDEFELLLSEDPEMIEEMEFAIWLAMQEGEQS